MPPVAAVIRRVTQYLALGSTVSDLHTRSFKVETGRTFSIVLPNGGGVLVAHGGEVVHIVVAPSYEKAVCKALLDINRADEDSK